MNTNCIITSVLTVLGLLALRWAAQRVLYYLSLPDELVRVQTGYERDLLRLKMDLSWKDTDLRTAREDRAEKYRKVEELEKKISELRKLQKGKSK